MKIRDRLGNVIDVYAVYWGGIGGTRFYGMPPGYVGMLAYGASDVEVVDSSLAGNFVFRSDDMFDGIFHYSLMEDGLLDDLLELDPSASKRFLNVIGRE